MSLAKLTINSFLNYSNNTLFDNLTLPDGIDKDLLIDNIVMEAGEFELMYANLDFMKSAIGVWSAKNYRTFEKWIKALNVEYNPLENYDRMEEWEDNHTGKRNGETSTSRSDNTTTSNRSNATTERSDKTTTTGSNNTTTSDSSTNSGSITNNQSNTTTNNVSAYDSTELVRESQSVDGGNSSSSSSGNTSSSSSSNTSSSSSGNTAITSSDNTTSSSVDNTTSNGNIVTSDSDTYRDTKTGRAHGNIGVTTSQQMLESELNIAKWNVYKHITDLFMQEFCIMVYI